MLRVLLGLALAVGCGQPRTAAVPEPPPCCTPRSIREAAALAEQFRVRDLATRRFTHSQLWSAMAPALASQRLRTETVGRSVLGRDIRAVTFGTGATRVLLWSQMHGDESAASMALADLAAYFGAAEPSAFRDRIGAGLTVVMVPMLNPDGAELFQRQNAAGIDVNRDARRLATPEGRALKGLHDRLQPHFAFNLHDQSARTRAGRAGPPAGIALLPPAYDEARSYNAVRNRARHVAATLAMVYGQMIPGRVAKYDDAFNPRAFGDLMQQWGASTVLIESGALPGDPEKQQLRALNFVGILLALDAIASRGYEAVDAAAYETLPFNVGGAVDLLVRGGTLVLPGLPPMRADVAINYDDAVARTGARVRDVGDLDDVVAIDTIDASGLYLHAGAAAVTITPAGAMLRIDAPAAFELRRGSDAAAPLARRIGADP